LQLQEAIEGRAIHLPLGGACCRCLQVVTLAGRAGPSITAMSSSSLAFGVQALCYSDALSRPSPGE